MVLEASKAISVLVTILLIAAYCGLLTGSHSSSNQNTKEGSGNIPGI